jgi:hypothetical protein
MVMKLSAEQKLYDLPKTNFLWHFIAPNVHDFVMWLADPDFIHLTKKVRDGLTLHAF